MAEYFSFDSMTFQSLIDEIDKCKVLSGTRKTEEFFNKNGEYYEKYPEKLFHTELTHTSVELMELTKQLLAITKECMEELDYDLGYNGNVTSRNRYIFVKRQLRDLLL